MKKLRFVSIVVLALLLASCGTTTESSLGPSPIPSDSSSSSNSQSSSGDSSSSSESSSTSETSSDSSDPSSESSTSSPTSLEHTHHYEASVTEPTCTEGGFTTYTCECGESYVDDYVVPLGHDYINHAAKAPTCVDVGWDAYRTCSRCDYSTKVEIPATGVHSYVNGICEVCGASQYQYVSEEDVANLLKVYETTSYTLYGKTVSSYTVSGTTTTMTAETTVKVEGNKTEMVITLNGTAGSPVYYELLSDGSGYYTYNVATDGTINKTLSSDMSTYPDSLSNFNTMLPFELMPSTFVKSGTIYSSDERFYRENNVFSLVDSGSGADEYYDYVLNVDTSGSLLSYEYKGLSHSEYLGDMPSESSGSFSEVGTTTVTIPEIDREAVLSSALTKLTSRQSGTITRIFFDIETYSDTSTEVTAENWIINSNLGCYINQQRTIGGTVKGYSAQTFYKTQDGQPYAFDYLGSKTWETTDSSPTYQGVLDETLIDIWGNASYFSYDETNENYRLSGYVNVDFSGNGILASGSSYLLANIRVTLDENNEIHSVSLPLYDATTSKLRYQAFYTFDTDASVLNDSDYPFSAL